MKKFASLLLALVIVLSLALPAFAQTEAYDKADKGTATITISNAAKEETYTLYKLFDATIYDAEDLDNNGNAKTIAYKLPSHLTDIPDGLKNYFVKDTIGNITATAAAKDTTDETKFSADAVNALKTWASTAENSKVISAKSDGSELKFTNLPFGLYIITSTQNSGSAITVDSTSPNATVIDKNKIEVSIKKQVKDSDLSIGDIADYTATFNSANYLVKDGEPFKVVEYIISDNLPSFLKDVKVIKITIDGTEYKVEGAVPQFDTSKQIIIPWVNNEGAHLYKNGAVIVINYQGTVTKEMKLGGSVSDTDADNKPIGNINTVTVSANVESDTNNKEPWEDKWSDSEEIFTYAAALKKVADSTNGKALVGAEFKGKGLTVEVVKPGEYNVISYNPSSTTDGTTMTTDINGYLVIKGLASDLTITLEETKAPAGYNKTDAAITLIPTKVGSIYTVTSKAVYYDADGKVVDQESATTTTKWELEFSNDTLKTAAVAVVNQAGSELPSTGGMGTTLFYIVGAGLMLAAAVLLVTKKRMSNN